jgi:transposase
MSVPFKSDLDKLHKAQHFSGNIFALLPEDHDCFIFEDLFQELDTSSLEKKYSPKGQHAYHPKKIISILIYGYTHGVFSSRQLERRCNEDLSFMYIARMNCPNFRVISDFRKDNAEFFQECFKQTVQLALKMKMASLGHVCFDGSKFKANSSKHKAMSYKHLKEKEQQLCEEIEELIKQGNACDSEEDTDYQEKSGYELPEELVFKEQRLKTIKTAKEALETREQALNPDQSIDDKKQISFADEDARIMGKNGSFDYNYNPQISVDRDYQIIVGQHVSQNANDQKEVAEGLASIEENAEKLPDNMSLDNGYASGENLEALEQSEVTAFVAMGREDKNHPESLEESNRKLVKADFRYDEEQDCFHCPSGQKLNLKSKDKKGNCVYQGDITVCTDCPFFTRCCQSKKGAARTINTDEHEALRQQMRDKMETEKAKEIYKQRKVIVEPVFGQIKNGGFRGFSLRGKNKVAGEFSLVCAAHNIKKMVRVTMVGLVCPESGEMATQGA